MSGVRPKAVLETVLYAADLSAAEAFYSDVLGLELYSRSPPRQLFYRCGDGMLLIFNPSITELPPVASALPVPSHGSRGPGHLCFRASAQEIDRWRTYLTAQGIAIESDFTWPSGGRSIYFRDPAGNSLEFAEPCIWELP